MSKELSAIQLELEAVKLRMDMNYLNLTAIESRLSSEDRVEDTAIERAKIENLKEQIKLEYKKLSADLMYLTHQLGQESAKAENSSLLLG